MELEKDTAVMPELTLFPFEETTEEVVEEEKPVVEMPELTPQEQQMVEQFSTQIDLKNSAMVIQYGAGTQKKLADFSEKALDKTKTKDLGEVGKLLSDLTVELKNFDTNEEKKGFSLFKKATNKAESLKAQYSKAETNVNTIVKVLEGHQVTLLKDIDILDKMYEMNLAYFKELSMYVLAGKKKLADTRSGELVELKKKAEASGLPEDAQAAKDLEDACDRFEKKIYDIELTRMIAIQTAPQIRLVQNSDTLMVEKIQSIIVNTIPLWKNQMVLALGMEHSAQAAKAQREVNNLTNELLKKNAEALKQTTVAVAKESERGIVDMETLKKTNESLISTLDEVMRIQEDGRAKRREAEVELQRLEGEMRSKLLETKR